VSREPARAGIDPFHELMERDRSDDVISVAEAVQEAKHEH
jgi:hypothetical protein